MSSVSVSIRNLEPAVKFVANLDKQSRFAMSVAINETLKDVQDFTVDEILPGAFTLRSRGAKWWKPRTRFGFNIKFSNKRNLEGRLGSRADWLKLQEKGGTKDVASHRLAIPTAFWKPKHQIMMRSRKPRRILARRRAPRLKFPPFVYEGDKMPPGIYVRTGKQRFPVAMLFHFVEKARIEKRLNFESKAENRALRIFDGEFRKAFAKALRTAR